MYVGAFCEYHANAINLRQSEETGGTKSDVQVLHTQL